MKIHSFVEERVKSNITRNPFKNEKVNSIYNIDIDGEPNSDKMTGGCCSDGKSLN